MSPDRSISISGSDQVKKLLLPNNDKKVICFSARGALTEKGAGGGRSASYDLAWE